MKVYEIMSPNVKTMGKDKTILDVMKMMKKYDLGFIVIEENKKALGVITDRDIILLLANELSSSTNICKVMKKYIITVLDTDDVSTASDLMGQMQIKRLVVVNNKREIVGILSVSDMAKNLLTEEYAFDAFVEISYDYSTINLENDNLYQLSAFIF
jgi:CBS domain-containing protein